MVPMMVRPMQTFTVTPAVPPALSRLVDIAMNLRWTWHRESLDLFRRLDPDLWEASSHNPCVMLGSIAQDRLDEASTDEGFIAQYGRVCRSLDEYMGGATPHHDVRDPLAPARPWFNRAHAGSDLQVAYFSMEFGLTECMAIYSGGLGLLAGDHLKSASDLGVPLVAVGLAYQEGYFRQYLNPDGWQGELYPDNDFYNLPMALERRPDGSAVKIAIELPGRTLFAQIWRVQVGRVPLLLLDANVPETEERDRVASLRLYSGDRDIRIRQEILLGVGGVRALEALGFQPRVFHMNEGHAAFLSLERVRRLMETRYLNFEEAREVAAAGGVFTTHTPVPAGIDKFVPSLIDQYFGSWYERFGISRHQFLALGRERPGNHDEQFSMAILAIRMAGATNGVSLLHGEVSRDMWAALWPGAPAHEVPIGAITNGVHALSWLSGEMLGLYDRYLGPRWSDASMNRHAEDRAVWERVNDIPGEELWRTHERRRERLISFARRRLRSQLELRGASPSEVARAAEVLDPSALTIGFARRFATYKRATLVMRDIERLIRIANDRDRPVQFIFAGKSHPEDHGGKELIKQIIQVARRDDLRNRIVFIENYDINVARYLVTGCDVWLNVPRRPHEASGTSGMKGAMNGVLHMSILDGWWDEAYRPGLGFAVGRREQFPDEASEDEVEGRLIYDVLEQEVIPAFYERGHDGLPRRWISMMKASIRDLGIVFNTNRMVHDYADRFYLPAGNRQARLLENDAKAARELVSWKRRIRECWSDVRVDRVDAPAVSIHVGSMMSVRATVRLGRLDVKDVVVELYDGPIDPNGTITKGHATAMTCADGPGNDRVASFAGSVDCKASGLHGYSVRVLPAHPDLAHALEPALITWAN
jgi:starch phosphorylase